MAADFDPYHKWLGIPPTQQPPHLYRLLGIDLFETDADVIANAADRQMGHVRSMASGPYAAASQNLLNELATAKLYLLDPRKKAVYDAQWSSPARVAPVPASPAVAAELAASVATPIQDVEDNEPATFEEVASLESSSRAARRGRRGSFGLAIRLFGHVAASVGGLALGYWILCSIGPQYDFLGLMTDAATSGSSGDATADPSGGTDSVDGNSENAPPRR